MSGCVFGRPAPVHHSFAPPPPTHTFTHTPTWNTPCRTILKLTMAAPSSTRSLEVGGMPGGWDWGFWGGKLGSGLGLWRFVEVRCV